MRYLIRRGAPWRGAPETYEVGKVDGSVLERVYRVWRAQDGSLQCDCPSGVHHPSDVVVCKHRRWVSAIEGAGPWTVDVAGPRDDGRPVGAGLEACVLEELVARGVGA